MKGKGESFHHAEKEEKWMNGDLGAVKNS